jgi:hypothetical protein
MFEELKPFLGALSLTVAVYALMNIRHLKLRDDFEDKIRKNQIILMGIHMLDNIRFHKIKAGKTDQLLFLGKPDEANTMQEERELREEIKKALPDITTEEISYVCDCLYRDKAKFR